jgi:hypothetical protein
MIRADEAPAAPMAELVRRPGLPGGAGDDDDPGPERGREQVGGSDMLVGRPASRRDRYEALGLLLGILGILLIVAVTAGGAPPV